MSGGPSLSLNTHIGQRLEQRQVLSQQTIQSLKILQLQTVELRNEIERQLLENPALEFDERTDDSADPVDDEAYRESADEQEAKQDDPLDTEYAEYVYESADVAPKPRSDPEASHAKQSALENTSDGHEKLSEHLLEQLHLKSFDPALWPVLEQIVYSLDERGFLTYPLEDVRETLAKNDQHFSDDEMQWGLDTIQSLTPNGVGARSVPECLLLQISPNDPDRPVFEKLLLEHWDDVLKNRLPVVAKAIKVPVSELEVYLELLATLDPQPGAGFASETNQVIVPDVVVTFDESLDDWRVDLTNEYIPKLTVSPLWRTQYDNNRVDKTAKSYLKTKLSQAEQLIAAVAQRQSTLQRVSEEIVKRQRDFVAQGINALSKMKMQDIADVIGIHHSTVWRAVTGKYMQTPNGVFEMGGLFTAGFETDDGGSTSREAVKMKIQRLVDDENKRKPLSDQAITNLLKDQGLKVSRRVVNKYRDELNIPDSRVRKQHA